MKFVTEEHEKFYDDHADIARRSTDYSALVYTLGIDDECRRHFANIYNAKDRSIIPDSLHEGWQTSASMRICRLAFNLFTWHTPADDDPDEYTPKNLLSNLDDEHKRGALLAMTYFA